MGPGAARERVAETMTAHDCDTVACPTPPPPLAPTPRPDDYFKRTNPSRAPARASAPLPQRILYIFSGPERRLDGVAALAEREGFETDEIDVLRGGVRHDVLRHDTRARLLARVRDGTYAAVLVATPCTSFSVARGNHLDGCVHVGLRTFEHESGPPDASAVAKEFVRKHDIFVDFTVDVAHAALERGAEVIIENPAPRSDPRLDSFWRERAHMPQLWDMRRMRELRATGELSMLVVPQCAFGPGPHGMLFQKYTGLLASRRAAARLADLRHLRCHHAAHDPACGANAVLAAAYPAALNDALVAALTGRRRTTPLPAQPPRAATPQPAPPPALEPAAQSAHPAPNPTFDRSVASGYIADGPQLLPQTNST